MASDPGASGEGRSTPPPGSAEEALRRLEQRLDRASEAAERLMAQAAAAAAGAEAGPGGVPGDPTGARDPSGPGGAPGDPTGARDPSGPGDAPGESGGAGDRLKPPPAGWQVPGDDGTGRGPDLDPLLVLVQAVRDLIPPDLQHRLVAALREMLLALRALIDWYLERLERRREGSVEVQDIPIL